jgi:hypothetical protein
LIEVSLFEDAQTRELLEERKTIWLLPDMLYACAARLCRFLAGLVMFATTNLDLAI